jgi:peptide deformylase
LNTLVTLTTENHKLKTPAEPIDFEKHKDDIPKWIEALTKLMDEHKGVGIAGPQAGINYRIAIVKNTNGHNLVLLNPSFKQKTGLFSSKEGCLSIPGLLYKLKRFGTVVIENHTSGGASYSFSSWTKELSRRIQHEIDHLDGVLICNRGKKYDL